MQSEDDPAILVVKSLIESYPKVDAKLFIGESFVTSSSLVSLFRFRSHFVMCCICLTQCSKEALMLSVVSFGEENVIVSHFLPFSYP